MIYFKIDAINRISTCVMTLILVCTGLYTTSDGKEKRQEKRFCGFYLIFCGMVTGLNFAGNLITFYFFWGMDERGLHSSCATQTDKGSLF